jgi:hypothetical protein
MTMYAGHPSGNREETTASASIDADGRLGWTIGLTYVNHHLNVVSMHKPKMLTGLTKRYVIGYAGLFSAYTDTTITGEKMEPHPSCY